MAASCLRRPNVDLTERQYLDALDMVPFAGKTGDMIKYTFTKFKNAPKWAAMAPYRRVLDCLVTHSGGACVNQKSFLAAARKNNEIWGHTESELEIAVYRIRAMLCQMANHKSKDRVVPMVHRSKFQTIFDKLVVFKGNGSKANGIHNGAAPGDDDDHDDDDDDDDDIMCLGTLAKKEPDVVVIDEGDTPVDLQLVVRATLTDADPALQVLLDSKIPRRRCTRKQNPIFAGFEACSAVCTQIAGLDIAALQDLAKPSGTSVVSPQAYRTMNADLKKQGKNKGGEKAPKKKQKTTKKKKVGKSMKKTITKHIAGSIPFQTYLKREHSRVWHSERNYQRSVLGKNDADAKAAAAVKASITAGNIRAARDAGTLPNHVVA